MNNILIICSHYGSSSDASGICIQNVTEELVRRGNHVTIIAETDEKNDVTVVNERLIVNRVEVDLFGHICYYCKQHDSMFVRLLFSLILLFRNLIVLPLFPNTAPTRSYRVLKLARSIINDQSVDTVLCAYRPFESIYCALKLKEEYPSIRVMSYHLDLLTEPNNTSKMIRKWKVSRAKKVFNKEIEVLDRIILPTSVCQKVDQTEKIVLVDFPMFVASSVEVSNTVNLSKDAINCVYIGSVDSKNRNPERLLELANRINELSSQKVLFHFWGSIEAQLVSVMSSCQYIRIHGMMDPRYVLQTYKDADFVIYLANKTTPNMLPSKIFQLIASQRPIIAFLQKNNDCSLPYFKQYGEYFIIDEREGLNCQLESVYQYLIRKKGVIVRSPINILDKCTPSYLIDKAGIC